MRKAMLSQPMNGKSENEIIETKEKASDVLISKGHDIINTLFKGEWCTDEVLELKGIKNKPLWFLAKSIDAMSKCDAIYFCKWWENAPPMHPNCRCSTAPYSDRKAFDEWLNHIKKVGDIENLKKKYQLGIPKEYKYINFGVRRMMNIKTKYYKRKYTADKIRNIHKDSKQYEQYKNIVGVEIGSLDEFKNMKYNKPRIFRLLTDYKNSVEKGMISPLSGFENYRKLYYEIEDKLVGIKISNGIETSGQSKHFIERVIGTKEDPEKERPRSGVEIEDIKNALLYGKERKNKRDPDSVKLITDKCIVSVNPHTGILIPCNPQ